MSFVYMGSGLTAGYSLEWCHWSGVRGRVVTKIADSILTSHNPHRIPFGHPPPGGS
jgi:hypothetical protein